MRIIINSSRTFGVVGNVSCNVAAGYGSYEYLYLFALFVVISTQRQENIGVETWKIVLT